MSVYQRPDSRFWWIWIEASGQRFSSKVPIGHGPHKRDSKILAEQIYQATMGDKARGVFKLPGAKPSIPFREWADWYRTHVTDHQKGKVRARSMLKKLTEFFGDHELSDIDADLIEGWKTIRASQVKKQTVNRELEVLRPMLRKAVPKYLDANPCDGVKQFRKLTPAITRIVGYSAEDAILAVATPEERALVLLGTDALLRLGDARRLTVERDHGTHLVIIDTKVKPYKAPVSSRLREALDAIKPLAEQRGGFYFARKYKQRWAAMNENTAYLLFADLCDRANVPRGRQIGGITFHSTRHTGATRAARKVKLRVVQELGGWSSLKQLERYDHPDDPELVRAVEAIGSRPTHVEDRDAKKQA